MRVVANFGFVRFVDCKMLAMLRSSGTLHLQHAAQVKLPSTVTTSSVVNASENFQQAALDFHWIYGFANDQATVEKIFVPWTNPITLQRLKTMAELKVVSLDLDWLPSFELRILNYRTNLTSLSKLSNLEELYLPRGVFVSDFSFMKNLNKLQHLQVDPTITAGISFAPNSTQRFQAKYCLSLKSLVLFSVPDIAMQGELLKIKTLEELTIVDMEQELTTAENAKDRAAFEQKFQGVNLRIVPEGEYQPDIPLDLQQHVQRIRADVKKKYLDE